MRLGPFLVLASVLAGHPASAGELPVCARPEVVRFVAQLLAARGSTAQLQPWTIGEVPGTAPQTNRCAVRLAETYYDTNRFGWVPQLVIRTLEYDIRRGRNGLFVQLVRFT